MIRRPPRSTLFPTRRSSDLDDDHRRRAVAELADQLERRIGVVQIVVAEFLALHLLRLGDAAGVRPDGHVKGGLLVRILAVDRKSTRLNSSHVAISYAVFCLK